MHIHANSVNTRAWKPIDKILFDLITAIPTMDRSAQNSKTFDKRIRELRLCSHHQLICSLDDSLCRKILIIYYLLLRHGFHYKRLNHKWAVTGNYLDLV